MNLRSLSRALALVVMLAAVAHAQGNTATVNGTVVDESKAVLPGVTVTASDLDTGRRYSGVTDERGTFQIVSLPPGNYKVQAELSGFAVAEVSRVELLVGQNAAMNFTLTVSSLRENVTVTGEAPLVDSPRARSPATSTVGRWRRCRCRGATGSSSRCWSRA